ncbi:MAG: hypothetical protein OEQ29_15685 [Alphaproteobacteria bacterium]|nr:hypothetical protein [Alphaproteobacteria bacterium]
MDETKVIAAILAAGCAANHPGCLPDRAVKYYNSALKELNRLEQEGTAAIRPDVQGGDRE